MKSTCHRAFNSIFQRDEIIITVQLNEFILHTVTIVCCCMLPEYTPICHAYVYSL